MATFWGVRGSLPVPGPDTAIFGGNTTCLEISLPSLPADRSLIIDAGSGLRSLGKARQWSGIRRIDLLLTHLHHDHIIGLPFFAAMFVKGLEIHLWCGNLDGETAESALGCMFAPPLFPLGLDAFPATLRFHGFEAGATIEPDGFSVATAPLRHPSGATGYRFDAAEGSLAVVTDIEHHGEGPEAGVAAFCRGVDTLVYDSMLEECDYGRCKGWGHSTIHAGVALGRAAGARRLVGCHHAPEHDDRKMAEREQRLQAEWPESVMAREGMTLVCGPEG
jgi:phosphoribosyl 1,2-cyclic phosphodiesterase